MYTETAQMSAINGSGFYSEVYIIASTITGKTTVIKF
jgi:hypothetical protein